MSCYSSDYLPQPPRLWSRVENPCAFDLSVTDPTLDTLVSVPYSNNKIPGSTLGSYLAMLNKGNVLQYKANSSNITSAQRYAKIARGKWTNRNTTWATQSTRGYTNPNTNSLKRNGNSVNIALSPVTGESTGVTDAQAICPNLTPITYNYIPINGGGGGFNTPIIPPPPPPVKPSVDPGIPAVIPRPLTPPLIIPDGGSLDCTTQENICTGETKRNLSQEICNPTYDSDVPGQIEPLCWRDGTPTWYPRTRYVMNNSTDKWPYNSGYPNSANKWGIPLDGIIVPTNFQSAIKTPPPFITSATVIGTIITLIWTHNIGESSLPIKDNIIFLNDIPIASLDNELTSASLIGLNCYNNSIFMISRNGDVYSDQSNVITVPINIGCVSKN